MAKAYALSDLNSTTTLKAFSKYKDTVKNFYLDGKMPIASWITPKILPNSISSINVKNPSSLISDFPKL
jgi:hypothetical protein